MDSKYRAECLRPGILRSSKLILEDFFANQAILQECIQRALSLGVPQITIDSLIKRASDSIVSGTSIYKYPPFPIDRSCEYSIDAMKEAIAPPEVRRELDVSTSFQKDVDKLKLDIDVMAYRAFISYIKSLVDGLRSKYKWNSSVWRREFPRYQKILNSRLVSGSVEEFKVLASEKDQCTRYHI